MKRLSKLTLAMFLFVLCSNIQAQRLGFKASLNRSSLLIKDDLQTYSDDYRKNHGHQFGVVLELPMQDDRCFFETGLLISTKGTSVDQVIDPDPLQPDLVLNQVDVKSTLYYLELPMTMKRVLFKAGKIKVVGFFGPYVAYGISGKEEGTVIQSFQMPNSTMRIETEELNDRISWGRNSNDILKRMDYGLNVGAGLEFSHVQIRYSYDLGLANISTEMPYNRKVRNRVMGVSMAYFLNK